MYSTSGITRKPRQQWVITEESAIYTSVGVGIPVFANGATDLMFTIAGDNACDKDCKIQISNEIEDMSNISLWLGSAGARANPWVYPSHQAATNADVVTTGTNTVLAGSSTFTVSGAVAIIRKVMVTGAVWANFRVTANRGGNITVFCTYS